MGGLEIPTRILLALKHVTQVAKKTHTSCQREQVHGRIECLLMGLKWIQP